MKNQEFKLMLADLNTIQQGLTWWMVFRRWLFRPGVHARSFVFNHIDQLDDRIIIIG